MTTAAANFGAWLQLPLSADQSSSPPPSFTDARLPVLVIGAGPAGLAVMARLKEEAIAFDAVDRCASVGRPSTSPHPLPSHPPPPLILTPLALSMCAVQEGCGAPPTPTAPPTIR